MLLGELLHLLVDVTAGKRAALTQDEIQAAHDLIDREHPAADTAPAADPAPVTTNLFYGARPGSL